MRILYSILFLIFTVAFSANSQSREEYDFQHNGLDSKSVHLYPNPAIDYVHIKFEKVSVRDLQVAVYNIIGNEIRVETEIVDEHELRVRVKDLDSGYYLLAVKHVGEHFGGTYKFLKR